MTYSWNFQLLWYNNVLVGSYDDKEMPAVMLFSTDDCKGEASFHLYDRSAKGAGEYSIDDIKDQRRSHLVKSVMLRSGYFVTLFADNGWGGVSQAI